MKVQMLKAVHAGGEFRKVGEIVEVNADQANELTRTGLATAEVTEKKTSKAKK